jgi:hypothetical protein
VVGDRPQVTAVGLESLRQPAMVVHRSPLLVLLRHSRDDETEPVRQRHSLIISIAVVVARTATATFRQAARSADQNRLVPVDSDDSSRHPRDPTT